MNYDSYLARAIEIFNDKMDADFSRDNVILTCFMTDDQEEIFEQFCAQYFPYRLHDRYQEEGYFDFRASSFIGMDNGGKDGILLRTDIPSGGSALQRLLRLNATITATSFRYGTRRKCSPNSGTRSTSWTASCL